MNLNQHTMLDLGLIVDIFFIFCDHTLVICQLYHESPRSMYIVAHGNMMLRRTSIGSVKTRHAHLCIHMYTYLIPFCTKRQTRTAVWQVFVSCRSKGYEIKILTLSGKYGSLPISEWQLVIGNYDGKGSLQV